MTTTVSIVDDEATPGALVALVSVPFQTEKKVAKSKQLKYSYSCDQECSESSSLQLKDGTELATNSSFLGDAGKTNQVFTLGNRRRQGHQEGERQEVRSPEDRLDVHRRELEPADHHDEAQARPLGPARLVTGLRPSSP